MTTILKGIVGSTAYGLATPESDIDRLGVFVASTQDILSLKDIKETVVTNDPDITLHEVGKFIKLCLANNPTVMELLWLDHYEEKILWGQNLTDLAPKFLSQRVRKTYGGYARQQAERLKRRGDFGSDLKKRQAKHGRHCSRLLLQGQWILKHNHLRVKLEPGEVEWVREMGELAVSDQDLFHNRIERIFQEFDSIKSTLPQEPDFDAANNLLLEIREDYWI